MGIKPKGVADFEFLQRGRGCPCKHKGKQASQEHLA